MTLLSSWHTSRSQRYCYFIGTISIFSSIVYILILSISLQSDFIIQNDGTQSRSSRFAQLMSVALVSLRLGSPAVPTPALLLVPHYSDSQMERVFTDRRMHLMERCKKQYGAVRTNRATRMTAISTNAHAKQFILSDDRHRVLFCLIPKVGSTFFSKLLLTASGGFQKMEEISDDYAHQTTTNWPKNLTLRSLGSYSAAEQDWRLTNYEKVIWVRDPFLRLASAWHSKFVEKNAYYQPIFAPYIIEHFRKAPKNVNKTDDPVTLEEFLRFVIADKKVAPKARMWSDVHWAHFNTHCLPCHVDYHYIGKMGPNFPQEVDFVLRKTFNGTRLQQLTNKAHVQHRDDNWKSEIANLPADLLAKMAQRFKFDIEMFGYDAKNRSFSLR